MIELWYAILAMMLTVYVVLDSRNFGIGALHFLVARSREERRQVLNAVGPLWSWHEVWLIAFGGVMVAAFPVLYAISFSAYYLALFLILWCFVLRGISLEVRNPINDGMWQAFWDAVFTLSNVLLAILFGAALGNVVRGVPLQGAGEFAMPFFTNFGVRGQVGLLDWYSLSVAVVCLVMVSAHAALYLARKIDGPVRDRCLVLARRLWCVIPVLFIIVSVETWIVRPELLGAMLSRPLAWLGILVLVAGAAAVFVGLRQGREGLAFAGSSLVIAGLLGAGAVALFPVFLYSTLGPENSLTAYQAATSVKSLGIALLWWPVGLRAYLRVCGLRRHSISKGETMIPNRTEQDSLGPVEVPGDKLWARKRSARWSTSASATTSSRAR